MKAYEIRKLDKSKLEQKLDEYQNELTKIKLLQLKEEAKDVSQLGKTKRIIARLLTIMKENKGANSE